MNYCEIKNADIANGLGVRISLFVSGCEHHCIGCFNQEAWNFKYGNEFTDDIFQKLLEKLDKPYISGLTILGGEPLHPANIETVLNIVTTVRETLPTKNIWVYTGYTLDELIARNNKTTNDILKNIDVLVDGRFELDKKDITLQFRGSSNQRLIDMKQTTNYKQPTLLNI